MVAEGLGALLTSRFGAVDIAISTPTAVVLLHTGPFDLILLDLDFCEAGQNGFHLLQLSRSLDPGACVLVLSEFTDESLVSRALALGAAGFMAKGAGGTDLCDTVDAVLRGEQCVPAHTSDSAPFTSRQAQVMHLLQLGLGRKEIAARLTVSVGMIDLHIAAVQRKLGVHGQRALSAEIIRRGLHLLSE